MRINKDKQPDYKGNMDSESLYQVSNSCLSVCYPGIFLPSFSATKSDEVFFKLKNDLIINLSVAEPKTKILTFAEFLKFFNERFVVSETNRFS